MKKDQFKRIIKLLVPQIDVDKIKFGQRYYRAYLYVIRFFYEDTQYVLRMYMLENTVEVLKINSYVNANGSLIEDWELVNDIDAVTEDIRKQIIEIQGE